MDYRRFGDTVMVRIDPAEEIIQELRLVAEKENIRLASVEALGAVTGSPEPLRSSPSPGP